jgi:hypothetical protein
MYGKIKGRGKIKIQNRKGKPELQTQWHYHPMQINFNITKIIKYQQPINHSDHKYQTNK